MSDRNGNYNLVKYYKVKILFLIKNDMIKLKDIHTFYACANNIAYQLKSNYFDKSKIFVELDLIFQLKGVLNICTCNKILMKINITLNMKILQMQ